MLGGSGSRIRTDSRAGERGLLDGRSAHDLACPILPGRLPGRPDGLRRRGRPRPRRAAPGDRLHDRRRQPGPVHPRQLLRAVRPHRRGAGDRHARRAGARGRPRARDRHHDPLRHADLCRALAAGAGGRGRHGDDHAALSRGHDPRAGPRHLRVLPRGLGRDLDPDHDPGRAGLRHHALGRLPGAARPRGRERVVLQDRDRAGGPSSARCSNSAAMRSRGRGTAKRRSHCWPISMPAPPAR